MVAAVHLAFSSHQSEGRAGPLAFTPDSLPIVSGRIDVHDVAARLAHLSSRVVFSAASLCLRYCSPMDVSPLGCGI